MSFEPQPVAHADLSICVVTSHSLTGCLVTRAGCWCRDSSIKNSLFLALVICVICNRFYQLHWIESWEGECCEGDTPGDMSKWFHLVIELAARHIKVRDIHVLGHSDCFFWVKISCYFIICNCTLRVSTILLRGNFIATSTCKYLVKT